jgi:hypothetical protein
VKVYELTSGDYLIVSQAGVQTIVFGKPYALSGGVGIVASLRTIADAIEAAGEATAPIARVGVCRPA